VLLRQLGNGKDVLFAHGMQQRKSQKLLMRLGLWHVSACLNVVVNFNGFAAPTGSSFCAAKTRNLGCMGRNWSIHY